MTQVNLSSPSPHFACTYLIPQGDAGSLAHYTTQAKGVYAIHSKISYFEIMNKNSANWQPDG
jgi:hypothetical protein